MGNKTNIVNTYTKTCIGLICLSIIYSSVIQDKFFQIPSGMLIFGIGILVMFFLGKIPQGMTWQSIFTDESIWMMLFMIYMLPIGILFSPDRSSHTTQWFTSFQYLFIMIVISSIIRESGVESFHKLLLVEAIILTIVFFSDPVDYDGGRFSISTKVNPNGLGMAFSTGIWAALYYQQKNKIPLIIGFGLCGVFLYSIMLTGSRKALIAAALMLFLWAIFVFIPGLKKKKGWGFFLLVLLMALIAIFGRQFIGTYNDTTTAARMGDLQNEMTGGLRSDMYRWGWDLFKSNPIFGIGFQGYKHYYQYYSHATIVEVPVSGGIVGSIIYFTTFVISIKKCFELFGYYKKNENLYSEYIESKMLLILWAAMLFYFTCIIHPYQFDSYIVFGILFGQSSYMKDKLSSGTGSGAILPQERKYKYIR